MEAAVSTGGPRPPLTWTHQPTLHLDMGLPRGLFPFIDYLLILCIWESVSALMPQNRNWKKVVHLHLEHLLRVATRRYPRLQDTWTPSLGIRARSLLGVDSPLVSCWEPWPQIKRCWSLSQLFYTWLWTSQVSAEGHRLMVASVHIICKKAATWDLSSLDCKAGH